LLVDFIAAGVPIGAKLAITVFGAAIGGTALIALTGVGVAISVVMIGSIIYTAVERQKFIIKKTPKKIVQALIKNEEFGDRIRMAVQEIY
jgi:hypothetical protein